MIIGERPSLYRKTLGIMAIAVAITASIAIWFQIEELVRAGAFVWHQYFAYFTIITTILNVVALLFGGFGALQSESDGIAHTMIRHSLVSYAILAGLVYHLVLKDMPLPEGSYVAENGLPQQIFHTIVPIYLVVDWLINPHRERVPWVSVPGMTLLPAGWLGFSLYRGETTGWYPYQFMNPATEIGWPGVVTNLSVIAGVLLVSHLLLLAVNRLHLRMRRRGFSLA